MLRRTSALRIAATCTILTCLGTVADAQVRQKQPELSSQSVPVITVDGLRFRDLNRSGTLDPYEDWRLSAQQRATDLVGRMNLSEKAGLMIVPVLGANAPFGQNATGYDMGAARGFIQQKSVTAFSSMTAMSIRELAVSANALQAEVERSRLGIPALIVTDPRHAYQKTFGMSVGTGGFSQWPDFTGLAAIGDPDLVRQYGNVVRQDYRLVGFGEAISPQADLATEPRWPRINATFGEDPSTVAPMVAAYIKGVQGSDEGVTSSGVATVVKHWVGYGAAKDGLDSHNFYGRFADIKSDALAMHLKPFEAAFDANTSALMPAYSIFKELSVAGKPVEPVGAGFSNVLIKDLLRGKYGYKGVVLSDWAITADCNALCRNGYPAGQRPSWESISMAWGVESLTRPQRFARTIMAGVDQIGGEPESQPIIDAVQQGLVPAGRIDEAVKRILFQRFSLGLFERPFIDVEAAAREAGTPSQHAAGRLAQARAMVVLEERQALPLAKGSKLFLRNVDPASARAAGYDVVNTIEAADVAVVRVAAPYETLHPNFFFGSMQHEGSLAFPDDSADLKAIRDLSGKKPVIVDVYLDRPAILTPLRNQVAMLLADFGASDEALFDVLSGRVASVGRLPFELPSSMAAVLKQKSGLPHDSVKPLYPIHYRYRDRTASR